MAAPTSINISDLTGVWALNKSISDNMDYVLALQGISWLKRKAIGIASITLNIKHYTPSDTIERIDLDQILTGGISGNREERTLDYTYRQHNDPVFGSVRGRSRRISPSELSDSNADEAYLKSGWDKETQDIGIIHTCADSTSDTWHSQQAWGFTNVNVNGNMERRYVRLIVVTKDHESRRIRLVYDYISPLPERS